MLDEKNNDSYDYIKEAIVSFNEVMSKKQKDIIENINRANKGELFVLQFLYGEEKPVLPSELSEALESSTARISALLAALEKKGQIERNIDKSDRRNILVTLTQEGRIRAEKETKEIERSMSQIFAEMGKENTINFISLTKMFFELGKKHMTCTYKK